MTTHELVCHTNWELIKGRCFCDDEKDDIVGRLLATVSSQSEVERYHQSRRMSDDGRLMYPWFYIPPYNNGKKLITINGVMPKTQIFSANHYELETFRLLALWRAGDDVVDNMLQKTRERLEKTCFGKFCAKGECFEASIVTLRFLSAAFPREEAWLQTLVGGIRDEIGNKPNGKKRHSGTSFYYWLTLSELAFPAAVAEIARYKTALINHLRRSYSYENAYDRRYNPIAKYIVRNCLSRLPEYQYVKELEGFAGNGVRST